MIRSEDICLVGLAITWIQRDGLTVAASRHNEFNVGLTRVVITSLYNKFNERLMTPTRVSLSCRDNEDQL